jgi:mannose-6-phosphate isomerase-like protein (cupin superfamily)
MRNVHKESQIRYRGAEMASNSGTITNELSSIPADDLSRNLVIHEADNEKTLHFGVVGDTYTILLSGSDTAGRFCLIDMYVPPGGGPPPHRHDFEETFVLLDGELEATFRGHKSAVRAGQTVHIPANAPHQFHNISLKPVRMLCICSPGGQDEFFKSIGVRVAGRTTSPPKLDAEQQAAFGKKVMQLAPKYRTELLKEAS